MKRTVVGAVLAASLYIAFPSHAQVITNNEAGPFPALGNYNDWWSRAAPVYRAGGGAALLPLAEREARDGDAVAMRIIGILYASGDGVPRDDRRAVEWYRKAAARGDATAMFGLASAYHRGAGVPRDPETARHWLIGAAGRGDARARAALESLPPTAPDDALGRGRWCRAGAVRG
jgi:TPR repeat protein